MSAQRGATLLVVLVMLVVLTLLGIASIRMSSTSMLIVGNMQARRFVENQAQLAVEEVLNSIAPFNNPTSAVAISAPAGLTVTVGNRTCVFSAPAAGYSAVAAISPEDNVWEFDVLVTDSFTGAKTRSVQGTRIRQLSGACS
ncbi:MAG: PilX N-terminal domain-containing pilus assembly protein [Betaproteobacteria bacterium]|nr:PilX N-terminal domain-containing pilus assembly protein [Betaproteobacteria bacterium]